MWSKIWQGGKRSEESGEGERERERGRGRGTRGVDAMRKNR
jgi:hypothetical protein